jgi:hypothetical protein
MYYETREYIGDFDQEHTFYTGRRTVWCKAVLAELDDSSFYIQYVDIKNSYKIEIIYSYI